MQPGWTAARLAEQIAGFERATLSLDAWRPHACHLATTTWYARRQSADETLTTLRVGIYRVNAVLGIPPDRYHETVTRFYVWLVHDLVRRIDRGQADEELVDQVVGVLGGDRAAREALWSRYYADPTGIWEDPVARAGWVPPDRAPLPPAVEVTDDPGRVDLAQLEALFAAVGFKRPFDAALLRGMVAGSRWVVSAWSGGEMIGFCRAISDGVSNAYVSTVAVDPAWQRQGIGRAMMRRLLAGREEIKFVLHTSEAGESLYRGLGFADAPRMMVRDRR